MRSVSFSLPQRTERVSDVTPTKKSREETSAQPKRVRDVKQAEKRNKKQSRIFHIRRKPMTPQQQRQFARMLNSYQLRALRDWQGFTQSLPDKQQLNDAQLFILQAANHCQHLYPSSIRKKMANYLDALGELAEGMEADSEILQQLIGNDHYLEGLLSMLALCRKYDARERRYQRKRNRDEQEEGERKSSPELHGESE
ncbi:hypothetical protein BS333_08535 [Vibrio azureus]|uniref:Uncharacterized protein n=1 Tax=Vibrio azureus NBRC 104587 TaxID=1219077 RepID=U3AUX2_9VIBR|nr:hypothetical protein [Vibrio azureus]AUI86431.1 hypothetical protein BS333_08535 [Vibrio azureus]GAD77555.1 hypothetical protein VAZ01S_080_00050 [Vibrio azureus NBRC 104587]